MGSPRNSIEGRKSKLENETVIAYNESDELASVWTASPTVYRRMLKMGYEPDAQQSTQYAGRFYIPKRYAQPRKQRAPKILTEDHKAKLHAKIRGEASV